MAARASSETLLLPQLEHRSRNRSYSSALKRKLIIFVRDPDSDVKCFGFGRHGAREGFSAVRVRPSGRYRFQQTRNVAALSRTQPSGTGSSFLPEPPPAIRSSHERVGLQPGKDRFRLAGQIGVPLHCFNLVVGNWHGFSAAAYDRNHAGGR